MAPEDRVHHVPLLHEKTALHVVCAVDQRKQETLDALWVSLGKDATLFFRELPKHLEGIELIEDRDIAKDIADNRGAAWHVFSSHFGSPWAHGAGRDQVNKFWQRTQSFLHRKGYEPLGSEELLPDDLVVYGSRLFDPTANGAEALSKHFGFVREDGLVESKFGEGPVFAHPLKQILPVYGNEITFLRHPKRST